jgi:hypothetical protein
MFENRLVAVIHPNPILSTSLTTAGYRQTLSTHVDGIAAPRVTGASRILARPRVPSGVSTSVRAPGR